MFKRFTDCHKWQDPWYRHLSPSHKLLWGYMCDHCDNAGVWKIDFESASFFIGAEVEASDALKHMESRIHVLGPGHWLIRKFIDFQFGTLNQSSPLHISILNLIKKHTLTLPYPKAKPRVQEKEKEKERVKDVVVKDVKVKDVIPTLESMQDYAKEKGYRWDVEKCRDHYVANGWKVGRNPMKDWKAVMRNWHKSEFRTEIKNASDGSESFSVQLARRRAEGEAKKIREREIADESVSSGV